MCRPFLQLDRGAADAASNLLFQQIEVPLGMHIAIAKRSHLGGDMFNVTGKARWVAAVFLAMGVGSANAVVTYQVGGGQSNIPGLTGFATTGAMMDGMSVRAVFSGGTDETRLWADLAAPESG